MEEQMTPEDKRVADEIYAAAVGFLGEIPKFYKENCKTAEPGGLPTFISQFVALAIQGYVSTAKHFFDSGNVPETVSLMLDMINSRLADEGVDFRFAISENRSADRLFDIGKMSEDKSFRGMMEDKVGEIGRMIGKSCPPGIGFSLQLWQMGQGGWASYVSNCKREDMIKALREQADLLEKGE